MYIRLVTATTIAVVGRLVPLATNVESTHGSVAAVSVWPLQPTPWSCADAGHVGSSFAKFAARSSRRCRRP